MAQNKTKQTDVAVEDFLISVSDRRREESQKIIEIMKSISSTEPVMWGPSIIGFGSVAYEYESGHKGAMPILGFSPRKAALTFYLEGFDNYHDLLDRLGKHRISTGCLYVNKLEDVDVDVLGEIIKRSYKTNTKHTDKPTTVEEYVLRVPKVARSRFDELRQLVKESLPDEMREDFSYGILGYRKDDKRARVYISGWKTHVAMYPLPKDKALLKELAPYIKGKGTLHFSLVEDLPRELIARVVRSLI